MANNIAKTTSKIILFILLILGIVYGTNPPLKDALLTYSVFLGISYVVYISPLYQRHIIGLTKNKSLRVILLGLGAGGIFYLVTRFVPGLSLGFPLLPNAISDQMRFFIVVIIAPVVEEIFFRGALLAFVREYLNSEKKIQIAIIAQAILFAFAHLGAYVYGFYDYSTIGEGISAIGANGTIFISAGLFGYIAGFLVTRKGINNLLFSIIFHSMANLIILTGMVLAVI